MGEVKEAPAERSTTITEAIEIIYARISNLHRDKVAWQKKPIKERHEICRAALQNYLDEQD